MPGTSRARARSAFTLVELLVVIGIIALLIAILLPTLTQVREQANLIKCASNLRQVYNGLVIYTNENRDHYPTGTILGGYPMRRLYNTVDPANPAAGPELWGLTSVYAQHKYAPAEPKFWVCPGAPDFMQAWGMTYAVSTGSFDTISQLTSQGRGVPKWKNALLPNGNSLSVWSTELVSDNATLQVANVANNANNTGPAYQTTKYVQTAGKIVYLFFAHKTRKSLMVAVQPDGNASYTYAIAPGVRKNANNALYVDGSVVARTIENYIDTAHSRPD